MSAVRFLRDRRAELLAAVAATINVGVVFDLIDWTETQIATANGFAVAVLGVVIGRRASTGTDWSGPLTSD